LADVNHCHRFINLVFVVTQGPADGGKISRARLEVSASFLNFSRKLPQNIQCTFDEGTVDHKAA
jgi:hypothetical protein